MQLTEQSPKETVEIAIEQSEFANKVKTLNSQNWDLFSGSGSSVDYRSLTTEEIETLEKNGNCCEDWSRVQLRGRSFDSNYIRNCFFTGTVCFGSFEDWLSVSPCNASLKRHSGLFNSFLHNVVVGNNSLIASCTTVSNVIIEDNVVLLGCGEVSCSGKTSFGNGQSLSVGLETGGRETMIYSDMYLNTAIAIAGKRSETEMISEFEGAVGKYTELCTSSFSIICTQARVLNSAKIVDCFLGPHALIDGATSLVDSCILSTAEEVTMVAGGSSINSSIVQWGCEIDTMSIVVNSLLCEHSHVERHGKITDSILGPNSGVAEGECSACLVGPFVGFHHQALLIAAFWPEGKGNVGYGANVGSNHTSKAPDQEIWCGEGTFFGLGTSIKFPTNFIQAPYCIIASGVCTLPQKCTMPFSLINVAGANYPGVSPAFNEIIPGWVLSDNIYTILRNEGKYKKRNKAKKNALSFDVFRPEIVNLMIDARQALSTPKSETQGGVYLEKHIPGLGKNFLTDKNRKNGIDSYTFYIQYYALRGWFVRIWKKDIAVKDSLQPDENDPLWQHQLEMLKNEFSNIENPEEFLNIYEQKRCRVSEDTLISKRKDDERGARVIPDYNIVHSKAEDDAFVKETQNLTDTILAEISKHKTH